MQPTGCHFLSLSSSLKVAKRERTRFAPSPTGNLHLGGLRTALFNYLLAKRSHGQFIVRIEDTDHTRTIPGAMNNIVEVLRWAGLYFDEGPGREYAFIGSYVQSMRTAIYGKYVDHLLATGRAYRCYCQKKSTNDGQPGRYSGKCRPTLTNDTMPLRAHEASCVVRLRVPEGSTTVDDAVYGRRLIENSTLDDIILVKSDGMPTYHLANVIDDHLMAITTVMRGAEWLPSTALHCILYAAFEWEAPRFAHLPLLINKDGSKLSKRQGSAFVDYYREMGYLPEALVNFLAVLGWTPAEATTQVEVVSLQELIQQFSIQGINRADAMVDEEKLKWFNRQHLARLAEDGDRLSSLAAELQKHLNRTDLTPEYLARCIKLMSQRVTFIKEIAQSASYLFERPETPVRIPELPPKFIKGLKEQLEQLASFDASPIKGLLKALSSEHKVPLSTLNYFLRQVITGAQMGAPIVDTMAVLGREECLARIRPFGEERGTVKG